MRYVFGGLLVAGIPVVVGLALRVEYWMVVLLVPVVVVSAEGLTRAGWASRRSRVVASLAGALAVSAVAAPLAWLGAFAIAIDASLCGGGRGANVASTVAGFGVYGYLATWGFRSPRRLLWALPVAIAAGVAASLGMMEALPGGHGYCET